MRILALTSCRADYDLMSGLYRRLNEDAEIDLQLLVSGAHLSPEFGHTVDHVRRDGNQILLEVETLLDSDTKVARLKSASGMLSGFIDTVAAAKPDLILYAGDREDVMAGALIGSYLSIPTAHFFAGDHAADGHVDNPVRHAVSKLSSVHFASTEEHAQRLRSLGEREERIHVIGSVALDRIRDHVPMKIEDVARALGRSEPIGPFALVLFHPVDGESEPPASILRNLIDELHRRGLFALVGTPNADAGYRALRAVRDDYGEHPKTQLYDSLPRELFLTLLKRAKLIAGNSSAGILEAASIPIPAVNVGVRQRGRMAGKNVVFCDSGREAIADALDRALSPSFKAEIAGMTNPYGDGRSCARAHRLLKEIDFAALAYKPDDPLHRRQEASR